MNVNVALKVSYILKLAYRVIYLMYKLFFFFLCTALLLSFVVGTCL